jgi:hypothetical protein
MAMTAPEILTGLFLSGFMGMVGQTARMVVGLKKLSDYSSVPPSESDLFQASRIFIGLAIGFVAGVAAGFGLKIFDTATVIDVSTLLGLAAAGYAGTDFIEGFVQTIVATRPPSSPRTGSATKAGAVDPSAVSSPAETTSDAGAAPVGAPQPVTSSQSQGFAAELQEATKYQDDISDASTQYNVARELIYAVGSRESAWGLTLKPKGPSGTGDWGRRNGQMPPDGLGWGRGLMQIDYAAHEFARTGNWRDPHDNIFYGCEELSSDIEFFAKAAYPNVDPVRAGVAAYNCGRGNVVKAINAGQDVDQYTTGHDYSRDVVRRADWFRPRI